MEAFASSRMALRSSLARFAPQRCPSKTENRNRAFARHRPHPEALCDVTVERRPSLLCNVSCTQAQCCMQHPRGIEKDVAIAQLKERRTFESKKCFTSTVPSLKLMIYSRFSTDLQPMDEQRCMQ
jgi:hypothetical protein